jgi:16S rRNA (cytosine967-C5)-methyltransferase
MGKVVMNTSIEEKILTGLFLCSDESNEILAALKPEWNEKCKISLKQKLLIINSSLLIQNVFPWKEELSEGIDHEEFCQSFFIQPDLFLRLRPGKEKMVLENFNKQD